ncbi:ribonuclease H-like domain-containing protein [Tanacetum coccineum]|uniref:Ribonuclease H-like domain-containing protein n=1 Tax=Tanacetum coccineum TaxID=301880 RepID=A0ABQ4Z0H8_9ASTR
MSISQLAQPGLVNQPSLAQQVGTHTTGPIGSGSTNTGHATLLPQAFTVETLHDPNIGAWNMDTGASSHLNNSINSLSTVFNSCLYPSIAVGDGHSILVTNTGHSILPTLSRPLHLNNVLITPHIVKILIYVRQFVRENNCTIEFDAFGFSVKDFLTRRVLLRCDSTGDLYPVTPPSPIPHTFLVNQHTWHQRLGHLGSDVLRRLISNNVISCNKEKPPVLFHACQLGKHVRLPFDSSSTIVTSCSDIIHSDVWTSPIPSLFGFKYYVLFLDHYSHFVWVYPLIHKSDVLSKFMLFRNYVRTQFKCEIRSFQCDHGGEFDNRTLHKLFADNGIQFRFTCPKTSQQNGKSERMVRTINNIIRTLLFQANLPPTFWVEALNMAIHLLNILPSTAIANDIPFTRMFVFPCGSTQSASVPSYTFLDKPDINPPSVSVSTIQPPVHEPTTPPTSQTHAAHLLSPTAQTLITPHSTESNDHAAPSSPNSSQHVPTIIPDPPNPNPDSVHHMVTRFRVRTNRPVERLTWRICLHMHDPREPYFSALKRNLRYVCGTLDYGLQLFSSSTTDLVAYSDADWAGCPTTRRSTLEYRGVANAVAETYWLRNLLRELHTPLSSATLVYCDNVSVVYLSSNPVQHQRTKHIEIDIHFVRNLVATGQVRVLHVPSRYQFVDIFTKGLPTALFEEFRSILSVRCPLAQTAGEC